MAESKQATLDPIPAEFASIAEAAEFWDTHSLADYWEQTEEADVEVRAPRRQWVPLAANLTEQAAQVARQEGVSVETLVNLWVAEKLRDKVSLP
jgi:predicted HicB family RNase H-like nuclease